MQEGKPAQNETKTCGIQDFTDIVPGFSYDLFAQAIEEENPVLSPVSAYLAMGLAGAGASGETREEFEAVFGAEMEGNAHSLLYNLARDEENLKTLFANSAWVDDQLIPNEQWISDAQEYYEAQVYNRDLSANQTVKEINSWVNEGTKGLIKELQKEPFGSTVKLVLLNTIYFNGKWSKPFEESRTREEDFVTTAGNVVTVDMMNMFGEKQWYLGNEQALGIMLPYEGYTCSFVALKPVDGTVREMYEQLSADGIRTLLRDKQEKTVNLKLPKFKIIFDRVLNEDFQNMGITQAFDPKQADFTGIGTTVQGEDIYIDLVRQKAVVSVDERQTEAAAVTSVQVDCLAALPEEDPVDLFFDEPFLYMIVDNDSGIPLFMGVMDNPAAQQ